MHLVIALDPFGTGLSPVNQFTSLAEPQTNFLFSRFERVGTVDDVTTDRDAVLTTDGTRGGFQGVGGTDHGTTLTDHILTFPDLTKETKLVSC